MNAPDRFELDRIREDQSKIRTAVDGLDRRIDVLSRSLATSPVPAQIEQSEAQWKPALPAVVIEQRKPTPASVPPAPKVEPLRQNLVPPPLPKSAQPPPPVVVPAAPIPPASAHPPKTPPPPEEPLELRVGTYWMARVGILILLTGLVFLGNYAYHRWVTLLGPGGKVALLTLAGFGLGGLGAWMERSRESLRNFGRVLLAGGAATIYYTAYAAHFVERLRIIESHVVGGALLLALAGGIVWFAERRKSEVIALPAILLAYFTSSINPAGGFTLFSNLLLTSAAVFFLVRYRWTRLSFASLAATYGSYAFWRFHQFAELGAVGQFGIGPGYLVSYWILFTAAVFLAAPGAMRAVERTAFLTVNNGAFFAFTAHHFVVHRPEWFWMFAIAYGVTLLGLAALAVRRHPDEPAMDGSYLAQGLALLTVGLAAKLTGPQLAVVFAVESLALYASARFRHGWIYETAAILCAVGAFGLGLVDICTSSHPLTHGMAVTTLLLGGTWWTKYLRVDWRPITPRGGFFAVSGLILLGAMVWRQAPFVWQPAALAGVALLALAGRRARLMEITLAAQTFVPIAAVTVCVRCVEAVPSPWWSPLPVALAALAFVHWWQFARREETEDISTSMSALFAVLAMGTFAIWMNAFHHGEEWLVPASAASLAALAYGLTTRAWAVAGAGQIFTFIAVSQFAARLVLGHPHWAAALAPIATVAATGLLVPLLGQHRWPALSLSHFYAAVGSGCRALTGLMLAAWSFEYVPAPWRIVFFAGVGALQILAGSYFQNRTRIVVGSVYGVAGFLFFIAQLGGATMWPNLLAILVVPASLRLGARFAGEAALPEAARQAITTGALLCTWLWVTRLTYDLGWNPQLTTMWALLALVVLAAGLGLRDRVYRLGGFVILGCTLARLFIVDVWRFDTIYRIVSFLVLGVVLLGLSFVYNRFAETMRRWL